MLSVAWFSGHFVSVGINMLAHEPEIDSLNTGTRYLRSVSLFLVQEGVVKAMQGALCAPYPFPNVSLLIICPSRLQSAPAPKDAHAGADCVRDSAIHLQ